MKKTIDFTLIFIATVLILSSTLIISSKIPHSTIEENLKESVQFYKRKGRNP